MTRLTPDQYMAGLDLPEIYRVGGSVRNEFLGIPAKDADYMVRGADLTRVAQALGEHGATSIGSLKLRTGTQVGWRAKTPVGLLEVVLPRTEFSTGSGRHDIAVHPNPHITLEADSVRRDFTVNALYKDVKTGVVHDPTGQGIHDISLRQLRITHLTSFTDDPLRILRGLRFVATLPDFKLETLTEQEMFRLKGAVTGLTQKGVSGTALEELEKMLMGKNPGKALRYMRDTGVMGNFLPELSPMIDFEQRSRYHEKNTDEHVFDSVQAAANMGDHAPLRVRMALLFHDSGKPRMAWTGKDGLQHYYALSPAKAVALGAGPESLESHEEVGARLANEALKRLNAPTELRKDVVTLIERHMVPFYENIKPFKVRKWRSELGDELLHDLITHRVCDVIGKGNEDTDNTEAFESLQWIAAEQQRAKDKGVPITTRDLDIGGRELVDIGFRGPDIGHMQRQLLHEVLAQPDLNNNEWLVKRARSLCE